MPQDILDERRTKVDERIERWRGILGQDEPTWLRERGGPGRIGEHRADRRQRHRHPATALHTLRASGLLGHRVG